jgi:hypothetical protein
MCWSSNPYHYGGNDPVNRIDPSGLTEVATLEQLKQAYDDCTGPQWGNILSDALMVASVVVAVATFPASLGTAVLIGGAFAVAGSLAQDFGDDYDARRRPDWGKNLTNATVAGVVGVVTGGISNRVGVATEGISNAVTKGVVRVGAETAIGAGGEVANQVLTPDKGNRIDNWVKVVISGATSGGGAFVSHSMSPVDLPDNTQSAFARTVDATFPKGAWFPNGHFDPGGLVMADGANLAGELVSSGTEWSYEAHSASGN